MSSSKKFVQQAFWHLRSLRSNLPGRKINGKILIIESDDFGSIRTPLPQEFTQLNSHLNYDKANIYSKDCLETAEDLERLFNLLSGFKDSYGNNALITANVLMANPAFEKIKESGYEKYFFEPVSVTFQRQIRCENSLKLWKTGYAEHLFKPQLHGREHLQFKRWLRALRVGHIGTLRSFELGSTSSGNNDYSYMEAFDWDTRNDIIDQKQVLKDAVAMFEREFGFKSKSFIAPCYNWDSEIEATLYEQGVRILQGAFHQSSPTGTFNRYERKRHYFGELNSNGLFFNVRNCFLEPSMSPKRNWVDSCLAEIRSAFALKKPAVVCSHRINYMGAIDPLNADRGIRDLGAVLKSVLRLWPDVRFVSTDQLLEIE